jgi:hypothetical protein
MKVHSRLQHYPGNAIFLLLMLVSLLRGAAQIPGQQVDRLSRGFGVIIREVTGQLVA